MGAAFLAGLAVDFWTSRDEIKQILNVDKTYIQMYKNYEKKVIMDLGILLLYRFNLNCVKSPKFIMVWM